MPTGKLKVLLAKPSSIGHSDGERVNQAGERARMGTEPFGWAKWPSRKRRRVVGLRPQAVACAAIGAGALGGLLACTSLRGEGDTCQTVGTCTTEPLGGDEAGVDPYDWTCLGKAPPASTQSVSYTAIVADVLPPQTTPAGLFVSVCPDFNWPSPLDVDAAAVPCMSPESTVTPDGGGIPDSVTVTLPAVPQASSPYVYVTFEAPDRLPVAVWFNDPPQATFVGLPPVSMFDLTTAALYAAGVGVTLSYSTGLVVLGIHDCKGVPVAGAHATIDIPYPAQDPPVPFTLSSNGLPMTGTTLATDSSGQYGFGNVPAGGTFATVTAFRSDNVKIAQATVYVRPAWATAVAIFPP